MNALGQEDIVLEAFRPADRAGRNQIAYLLERWPSLTAEQRAAVFRVVDAMKIANDSRGKSTPFRVISRTVQSRDSERELVQTFRQIGDPSNRRIAVECVRALLKSQRPHRRAGA